MTSPVSGQGPDYHGIPTPELRTMASVIQMDMQALSLRIFEAQQNGGVYSLQDHQDYDTKRKEFSIITTELAGRPDIYANMSIADMEKLQKELLETTTKLIEIHQSQGGDTMSIADMKHLQTKMNELVDVGDQLLLRKTSAAMGRIK